MKLIVKIHGCSGSGKTTMVKTLMGQASEVTVVEDQKRRKPEAYVMTLPGYAHPVSLLGS